MMTEVPLEGVTPEVDFNEAPIDVPAEPERQAIEPTANTQSITSGPR
jgi:hypothetical protein